MFWVINQCINVNVYLNDGNRNFATPMTWKTDLRPRSVAVSDINAENKFNIIVTHTPAANIAIFFNDGNGKFANQETYRIFMYDPLSIAIAYINGDNQLDIIICNYFSLNIISIQCNW